MRSDLLDLYPPVASDCKTARVRAQTVDSGYEFTAALTIFAAEYTAAVNASIVTRIASAQTDTRTQNDLVRRFIDDDP